ncbi:MAG: pyridoxamine 5'-phosphate oxidase family protein [Gammaproteobacteria bacterium]|nr:pyridoxamine 5'-phosphate oxidase family protein [Gammaproteobacteria bacterium]
MKVLPAITDELSTWITTQPMYFLASAPLSNQSHVNLSPRGLDSLRVIDPNQVAILDLTGSGNETAAHLLENGRITVMMCAFEGEPLILRLYGEGEVVLPGDEDWADLRGMFADDIPGVRQIFRILVTRVQTSCGYGVPLMDFVAQRTRLLEWADAKEAAEVLQYQQEKNSTSIDGLEAPKYRSEEA